MNGSTGGIGDIGDKGVKGSIGEKVMHKLYINLIIYIYKGNDWYEW